MSGDLPIGFTDSHHSHTSQSANSTNFGLIRINDDNRDVISDSIFLKDR
jgi:hypothetical protein